MCDTYYDDDGIMQFIDCGNPECSTSAASEPPPSGR
jgi:hypothetical protein